MPNLERDLDTVGGENAYNQIAANEQDNTAFVTQNRNGYSNDCPLVVSMLSSSSRE